MPLTPITNTPTTNQIIPFDFNELYVGLESKFAASGYDISQGSNTSQLITAMAYFTSMLNINTAVNVNELLLPNATIRDNVLADARALGYEIQHKQSYVYEITLSFSGAADGVYDIPTNTVFTEGGKNYYYFGADIRINGTPGLIYTRTIPVKEGTYIQYTDYPTELVHKTTYITNEQGLAVPQNFVNIPFVDIEENGISVFITYYDALGALVTNQPCLKTNNFLLNTAATKTTNFYRVDDIKSRTPRIYFELNGNGNGLKLGTTISINVLQTSGVDGAMKNASNSQAIKHNLINAIVTNAKVLIQGVGEETIQSIKLNAPKFHNSANRAVTASDYQSICNKNISVRDTFVWGGDEEFPKSPGHVWFSFTPAAFSRAFTLSTDKTTYVLDNYIYLNWNYLTELANVGLTTTTPEQTIQLYDSGAYYTSKFVEDSEIRSPNQITSPGIWDTLDLYKIPTMQFHNRHPLYLHHEYNIEILDYRIGFSKLVVNDDVFNVVNNFFSGNQDTVQNEKFNSTYFHSSLEKRIDTYLTDVSGYNNSVLTKILITKQNVSTENTITQYKDVYIPLSVPYEPYFDNKGFLLIDMLPSIDTNTFIDYNSLLAGVKTQPSAKQLPSNIYTDWTDVISSIGNNINQVNDTVIIAPIRTDITETFNAIGGETIVTFNHVGVYPNDPATLDSNVGISFSMCEIILNSSGIDVTLVKDVDWFYDLTSPNTITLTNQLLPADKVTINRKAMCGSYTIFNGATKHITVQLYVNDDTIYQSQTHNQNVFVEPKSYLVAKDVLYFNTQDAMYLTTAGYKLANIKQVSAVTGPVIKTISHSSYVGSPIKMDLFNRDRYINLKYKSPNFKLVKNMLPVLTRVTFK